MLRLRAAAVVLLAGLSLVAAQNADEYGLAAGKKMPFHVADFVNGKYRQGCPSVMISNAKTHGIIVWTRVADNAAFELAKELDAKIVDGTKFLGFLVAWGPAAEGLPAKAKGLEHVVAGKGRIPVRDEWDRRGVDTKIDTLVFLLDRKDIKSMWSFRAGELAQEKINEVVGTAKKLAMAGSASR
jgi:hypothetical protein